MKLILLAIGLVFSAPAFASGGGTDAHGESAEESHKGEHHSDYIGDADGDHIPNWRDRDAGEDYKALPLAQHALNLFLFLAFVGFFARGPISDAIKNRALDIRKELTEAAQAREDARQQHADIEARLRRFESEMGQIQAEARAQGDREHDDLVARAEAEAERVLATAQRSIRDETARARHALRKEAVELAVELAAQRLSAEVEADDQRRLARQFLDSLKTTGVQGNG